MRHRTRLAIVLAVLAAAALAAAVAHAASAGGPAADLDLSTGGSFSTPSATYQTVVSKSFTATAGVIAVRFSAAGWVQDWTSGGTFSGHAYASLRARVLVNGSSLAPGPVVLLDNTGKIGVKKPRPSTGSFEWAGTVAGGATTVTVQVKNLHAFDNAQLNHFTLTVQHN